MVNRKPLVLVDGLLRNIPDDDSLSLENISINESFVLAEDSTLGRNSFFISLDESDTIQARLAREGEVGEIFVFRTNTATIFSPSTNDTGVGYSCTFAGGKGFTGNIGGKTIIGANNGGTPGTNLAGGIDFQLGAAVSGITSKATFLAGGSNIAEMYQESGFFQYRTYVTNAFFGVPSGGSFSFEQNSGGSPAAFSVTAISASWNITNFNLNLPNVPATIAETDTTNLRFGLNDSVGAAGKNLILTGGNGAAGFVGGKTIIGADNGGTPGTNLAGGVDVELGTVAGGVTAKQRWLSGGGSSIGELNLTTTGMLFGSNTGTALQIQSGGSFILNASSLIQITPSAQLYLNTNDILRRNSAGGSLIFYTNPVTTVLTTTDALQTLLTYVTSSNVAYTIVDVLKWSNDTDKTTGGALIESHWQNVAGTLTQVGATWNSADRFRSSDTGIALADLTHSNSGTSLLLRVDPSTIKTRNWNITRTIYERAIAP